MAKKNDAAYDAFLADLKTIAPGIEEIIKDEKVSAKLREGVLARAEFSSQMDELKAQRAAVEGEIAEARNRVAGWQTYYGAVEEEAKTSRERLAKYQTLYGDLTDHEKKQVAAESGMTKDEVAKLLKDEIQQRDLANLKFADDLTDCKLDYKERFKEKLPTDKLYEVATKNNLPLSAAYNLFIADRVEEARKADYDEAIKRAREEGAAEARAKVGLPILSNTPEYAHVLDVQDAPKDSHSRVAAALAGLAAIRAGK